MEPDVKLERDSRLGKFVIRQRIGSGGMGAVYRAFDTFLEREVAIKTILSDKTADRDFLLRFRREALAISKLNDPNIVSLIDFVEGNPQKDEPPYMVMELLRGQDLHTLIRKGPVGTIRIADIMLQTCSAVSACHRHGFVHRDLKATNIFLTDYNQIETAKVLDFGVTKLWGESPIASSSADAEVTRKGMVFGTPEYLAPEVFRGVAAGPKTDQYALGILLYTALTGGEKPFKLEKGQEYPDLKLWQAIVKGAHPSVRSYRPEVPAGLEAIVERAMHLDPAQRFESVHTLGEALLPWASERARLQWTGHFTSAPQPPPVHSAIIEPDLVKLAQNLIAQRGSGTLPTVPAHAVPTREVSSHEFSEMATIVSEGGDPERTNRPASEGIPSATIDHGSGYLRLSPEELSAVPRERGNRVPVHLEPAQSISISVPTGTPTVPPEASSGQTEPLVRRPIFFVSLAVVGLIFASAIVFVTRRHAGAPAPRVSLPAEIERGGGPPPSRAALAVPSHAERPASVPATVSPATLPGASVEPVAPPVAAGAPAAPTPELKRPVHRKKPRPVLDQNGIGIPTE
jgi:serine/threonine protein kinase